MQYFEYLPSQSLDDISDESFDKIVGSALEIIEEVTSFSLEEGLKKSLYDDFERALQNEHLQALIFKPSTEEIDDVSEELQRYYVRVMFYIDDDDLSYETYDDFLNNALVSVLYPYDKDENGEEFKDFADVDKSTLPIDIYWHE